ncbi:MAG: hypothetical protein LC646_07080, partial [Xanthomonadaceae bacterium]|nr:hypothetical protein [Xanthomonadaceae bacterium]
FSQSGGDGRSRLARLAARVRHLYGTVLAQAEAAEPGMREVPEIGRVPVWQWMVPVAIGLLLWYGVQASSRLVLL